MLADSQWEQIATPMLIEQSAKLIVTMKLLEKIALTDEKVILFAERRKTQHLLAHVIREQFGLANVSIVNGDTPGSIQSESSMKMSRQQAVDRFQESSWVSTLSLCLPSLLASVSTSPRRTMSFTTAVGGIPPRKIRRVTESTASGKRGPVHIYLPMAIHEQFRTFDVILHELLERKRQLSRGTLFPTERAEVTPADILSEIESERPTAERDIPLTIEHIDRLEPRFFEVFVAALFQKQGYRVELTPSTGDKGADVIAHPASGRLLWDFDTGQTVSSQSKARQFCCE